MHYDFGVDTEEAQPNPQRFTALPETLTPTPSPARAQFLRLKGIVQTHRYWAVGVAIVIVLIIAGGALAFNKGSLDKAQQAIGLVKPSPTPTLTLSPVPSLTPVVPTITNVPKKIVTVLPTQAGAQPAQTSAPVVSKVLTITSLFPYDSPVVTSIQDCLKVGFSRPNSDKQIEIQFQIDDDAWSGWYPIYEPCLSTYLDKTKEHRVRVQIREQGGAESAVVERKFTFSDTQAPVFSEMTGIAEGATYTGGSSACFPSRFNDNFGAPDLKLRFHYDAGDWSEWREPADISGYCLSGMTSGAHTFKVQAKDAAGNESTVYTRSFSIQAP